MLQIVKQLITKAREWSRRPTHGHVLSMHHSDNHLHHHVNSTTEGNIASPLILIMANRQQTICHSQHYQNLQKSYHDQNAKDLPPLHAQELVRVQDPHNNLWISGEVTEVLTTLIKVIPAYRHRVYIRTRLKTFGFWSTWSEGGSRGTTVDTFTVVAVRFLLLQ